jgi:hypothetical protein
MTAQSALGEAAGRNRELAAVLRGRKPLSQPEPGHGAGLGRVDTLDYPVLLTELERCGTGEQDVRERLEHHPHPLTGEVIDSRRGAKPQRAVRERAH